MGGSLQRRAAGTLAENRGGAFGLGVATGAVGAMFADDALRLAGALLGWTASLAVHVVGAVVGFALLAALVIVVLVAGYGLIRSFR
jgi:hypothetical protein